MNIITLNFNEPLIVEINGEIVEIIPFKTPEHGNVKFGINAPKKIKVHREEIYHAIKSKQEIFQ